MVLGSPRISQVCLSACQPWPHTSKKQTNRAGNKGSDKGSSGTEPRPDPGPYSAHCVAGLVPLRAVPTGTR